MHIHVCVRVYVLRFWNFVSWRKKSNSKMGTENPQTLPVKTPFHAKFIFQFVFADPRKTKNTHTHVYVHTNTRIQVCVICDCICFNAFLAEKKHLIEEKNQIYLQSNKLTERYLLEINNFLFSIHFSAQPFYFAHNRIQFLLRHTPKWVNLIGLNAYRFD